MRSCGEAELLQRLSDIGRVEVDAEPLGDDTIEVHPAPDCESAGAARKSLSSMRRARTNRSETLASAYATEQQCTIA